MALSISNRTFIVLALVGIMAAAIAVFVRPTTTSALPDYAAKTGQSCATCHVNPAGGGPRTAKGQAFEAIPTHTTDPAGAWAQVSGAPAPASAPAPAPAPAQAPSSAISAVLSGASTGDSVVYSIVVRNTGDKDISNVYVAGYIPAGTNFSSAVSTPEGASFFSSDNGSAAWLVDTVAAKSSVGPFVYKVTKGSAQDLSANAFVHWTTPSDGTATSATITPLTNSESLAVDQAINNKLNKVDNNVALWNIQPGLGTVMIEYGTRFSNLWFAAQAGNWDMVRYQIGEMTEIQEVGETTKPGRAPALKAFENAYLDPLMETAGAKDITAFTAAYDKAINGCNSCHASVTGLPPNGQTGKFIKIQRPTTPVNSVIDWKGQ